MFFYTDLVGVCQSLRVHKEERNLTWCQSGSCKFEPMARLTFIGIRMNFKLGLLKRHTNSVGM